MDQAARGREHRLKAGTGRRSGQQHAACGVAAAAAAAAVAALDNYSLYEERR